MKYVSCFKGALHFRERQNLSYSVKKYAIRKGNKKFDVLLYYDDLIFEQRAEGKLHEPWRNLRQESSWQRTTKFKTS